MEQGLIEAELGGHLYKKRTGLRVKVRVEARTLIAFKLFNKAIFIYGFMKNERENINSKELKVLKLLADQLLNYSPQKLQIAINTGELNELQYDIKETT